MAKEFLDPIWVDENKDRVQCFIRYDNGEMVRAVIADDEANPNPDWAELFESFTAEQLDESTEALNKQREEDEERRRKEQDERQEREENERLFNHKIKLFEVEEIQNSKNRAIKSKIRKAKSMEEASMFASVLVTLEVLEEQNKPAEAPEPEVKPAKTRKSTKKAAK